MPIVNFSVPTSLDKRIVEMIKKKGFSSKAEFFRFAAIHLMDVVTPSTTEKEAQKTIELTDLITKEISRLYKGKKLPSIRAQLENV